MDFGVPKEMMKEVGVVQGSNTDEHPECAFKVVEDLVTE